MDNLRAEAIEIARTIFQQLGGRGFSLMIGMSAPIQVQDDIEHAEVSAYFQWKAPSLDGLQAMRVTLVLALDTYRVTFGRFQASTFAPATTPIDDVYCEDLQPLFEKTTGLVTIPPVIIIEKPPSGYKRDGGSPTSPPISSST